MFLDNACSSYIISCKPAQAGAHINSKHNIHPHLMPFLVRKCVPQIPVVQSCVFVESTHTHTCNIESVVGEGREEGPLLPFVNGFFYGCKSIGNRRELVVLKGGADVQFAIQVIKKSNTVGSLGNVIANYFCGVYYFCLCVADKNVLVRQYWGNRRYLFSWKRNVHIAHNVFAFGVNYFVGWLYGGSSDDEGYYCNGNCKYNC